jgi:hypothetical protein
VFSRGEGLVVGMEHDPVLAGLVAEAATDPERVGLLLHGSRAAGTARPDSDYDLICVVSDAEFERRMKAGARYERRGGTPEVDILYQGLSRLRERAQHPDEYTSTYFPNARLLFDRDGAVARVLATMRAVADQQAGERLMDYYDTYCVMFIRSLKAWRRGDVLAARMDSAESAAYLIRTLYAAQSRWTPYHDHVSALLPELDAALAPELGWPPGGLAGAYTALVLDPRPAASQDLQRRVDALLANRGHRYEYADEPARVQEWSFEEV